MSSNQRVKLAQELHDGIAQDLVGLGYRVDSLVAASGTPPELRSELRSLRFVLTELVDKVRLEILTLRSSGDVLISPYETSTQFELQRVFAELLRNSLEHSLATLLTIHVQDNGIGGASEKRDHYGLAGITERVKNLHGDIDIKSDSLGTRIIIKIPVVHP